MEWLQLSPTGAWSFALTVWFFGVVAGYSVGRAHAVWIEFKRLGERVNATVEYLNRGKK